MTKWVYLGSEGDSSMKALLGGKGSNLCQMLKLGIHVPPVFVVTTEACNEFLRSGEVLPDGLVKQVDEGIAYLESEKERVFGDESNPLLVSVRSGSPISMPGMMETILNIGLNDNSLEGLAKQYGDKNQGNKRLAFDCYRRLIQMYSDVALGIDHDLFEEVLSRMKDAKGFKFDTELDDNDLKVLTEHYKQIVKNEKNIEFPQEPRHQLIEAIKAVLKSWNIPRAIAYRDNEKIRHDLGTAVNVQVMVFGNVSGKSATGVAFTRNPSNGEPGAYGEFLMNAQGEDVVAGIRTPEKIIEMKQEENFKDLYSQLEEYLHQLEDFYKDMQDVEFTIEEGMLWVLQTRAGKRTGKAAVKIAVDMEGDDKLDKSGALKLIDPISLNHLLLPNIDPKAVYTVMAKGLDASPGAACGPVIFTIQDAKELAEEAEEVEKQAKNAAVQSGSDKVDIPPEKRRPILVRKQTTPDDIEGIICAQGILTSQGGMTSHAAVVARGMGKPCVAGCVVLDVNVEENYFTVGDKKFVKGDVITIDGTTGNIIAGPVNLVEPDLTGDYEIVMGWADRIRKKNRYFGVRANADDGPSAEEARRKFGAEGIGLARTEHMFMGKRADDVADLILMLTSRSDVERSIRMEFANMRETRGVITGLLEKLWEKGEVAKLTDELDRILAEEKKHVPRITTKLNEMLTTMNGMKGHKEITELIAALDGLEGVGRELRELVSKLGALKKFNDLVNKMLHLLRNHSEKSMRINKLLVALGKQQKDDFIGIFRAMAGLPVTIRLIDPPLHEFIPKHEDIEKKKKETRIKSEIERLEALDEIREKLHEENPMLGLRGCRLGILYQEITKMQVRAIFEAALAVDAAEDIEVPSDEEKVNPEIMIPLIAHKNELKLMKKIVEEVAKEVFEAAGKKIKYKFGTMIELPRAALTAEEIAVDAEFFSFGTNDLTQTCYGISRDDAEKHFLQYYVEKEILPRNPFQVLDEDGVGRLMRIAIEDGRKERPDIKLGICGEHGGDPESIDFCHRIGLEYVSCSPFRVPVARLAAAQAVIREQERKKAKGREQ